MDLIPTSLFELQALSDNSCTHCVQKEYQQLHSTNHQHILKKLLFPFQVRILAGQAMLMGTMSPDKLTCQQEQSNITVDSPVEIRG